MGIGKKTLITSITILIFSLFLMQAVLVKADNDTITGLKKTADQATLTTTGTESPGIPIIIGNVLNYMFGAVAVIFVTIMLIGGYIWMSAAGNEENVKKAKTFILNGIFGLMAIFAVYAIVGLIFNVLNAATNNT